MNIISGKHISRRAALKGLGATVGLPLLDAMVPAGREASRAFWSSRVADPTRLVAIEMVHGSAGSNRWGESQFMWAPEKVGSDFDLTPSALLPLEPFRDYLTIVSNTDCRMGESVIPREEGGDHFRTSAVFLTQSHPRQTEGSDIRAGTSLDQLYAQRFGQDTPIPSVQLSMENVDQSGGCAYGYACVYMDTISWASPTDPLPMTRDPRVAFDQLFGSGGTPEERAARRRVDRSILDWITSEVGRLKQDLGPTDRGRLDDYLEDIRELERRIQRIEAKNATGSDQQTTVAAPKTPTGVPDSFTEHVEMMFDLQVLAFVSDLTRVFSFKMGRDASGRSFPESGTNRGFHSASHHGGRDRGVTDFYKINLFHVGHIPYFLDKLQNTMDGDKNLLEKTLLMYGSSMGDSNLHNHKRCPLFLAGHANGQLKGNQHIKAPDGTSMADAMLTLLHKLGLDDLESFGDSAAPLAL